MGTSYKHKTTRIEGIWAEQKQLMAEHGLFLYMDAEAQAIFELRMQYIITKWISKELKHITKKKE